jgi:hypothetical protein
MVTDLIEIQGDVWDAQDGWLWDTGYEWYVDGKFWDNYGSFYFFHYPYMLKPGEHTITLKATNSAGLSSSKDFRIEIIEDESALPDDWSRNDITLALRLGFYEPLDFLDAPITRLQLAKLLFNVYSLVLPEDFELIPDSPIVPDLTDMSGDQNDMDYLMAYLIVSMGLMEIKNASAEVYEEFPDYIFVTGEFDPYGSVTEREAMQAIYKTIEISRNQTITVPEPMDESEFIPTLTEWGLFDEAENAYQADKKMTNRLTMVRVAKFIKYEFELGDKDYGIDAGFFDNYYKD